MRAQLSGAAPSKTIHPPRANISESRYHGNLRSQSLILELPVIPAGSAGNSELRDVVQYTGISPSLAIGVASVVVGQLVVRGQQYRDKTSDSDSESCASKFLAD
jgi:hypothetical protein